MSQFSSRLARSEFWIIGGAVLLSAAVERLLPYTIALGLSYWLARWRIYGQPTRSGPLNLPILILLLATLVSLAATPLIGATTLQVMRLLAGMLLCFSLINMPDFLKARLWILKGLLGLGLLLATSSLFFVDWVNKFRFLPALLSNSIARVLNEVIHPNVMAGILILFIAGMFSWTIFTWGQASRLQRIGLIGADLYLTAILILTQSRGGMLALAGAMAAAILLRFRRGWILVSLTLGLGLILLLAAGPQITLDVVGNETGGTGSFVARKDIWLRAGLAIQDFPLTGIGMGTFGEVVNVLYPISSQSEFLAHAHNLFLQIALDLGLPGLAAWLACWFLVIRMAWQIFCRSDQIQRALGAVLLCSQVAFGLHGLIDCVTWDTRSAIGVWFIWGLTAAAWYNSGPKYRTDPKQPLSQAVIEKAPVINR